ncbi:DUF4123 domain-containing protein [Azospirillum doebereinerae]|uniref:DUF4123 domain-containing protein n=1 Tax=Azospirillum doebereinerae TaxID=92933 RepID=A0A3S0V856_9PROT|nr:DUF4123 domain-containing protein [Azospirillum doebereinerae]MCG5240456.1 DUF4123 domain-containing protein [Azospirillum doebereinerae]RUQ74944.1 DUF4123 domain-containing protein [Azospirillum doebereinerae]
MANLPTPRRDIPGALAHHLWPDGGRRALYMLVDAARDPGLYPGLLAHEDGAEMLSLYQGDKASELAAVAPYIVRLERGSAATAWLLGEGWGRGWGVLVQAEGDIETVRRHFRKFTIVNGEGGETYLFRFYDPAVLALFLPTCDAAQRAALFGPSIRYMMEDAGADALVAFELVEGDLRRAVIPVAAKPAAL